MRSEENILRIDAHVLRGWSVYRIQQWEVRRKITHCSHIDTCLEILHNLLDTSLEIAPSTMIIQSQGIAEKIQGILTFGQDPLCLVPLAASFRLLVDAKRGCRSRNTVTTKLLSESAKNTETTVACQGNTVRM